MGISLSLCVSPQHTNAENAQKVEERVLFGLCRLLSKPPTTPTRGLSKKTRGRHGQRPLVVYVVATEEPFLGRRRRRGGRGDAKENHHRNEKKKKGRHHRVRGRGGRRRGQKTDEFCVIQSFWKHVALEEPMGDGRRHDERR